MKTMGLSELVIVGTPVWDEKQARATSVHASDVYDSIRFVDTVHDALADTVIAAGVTRRRGRFRKYRSYEPEEFAALVRTRTGTIGVVFGNEEHGLTAEELAACDTAVSIPSSPEFPSLNLSHAVQIVAYALFRDAHAHADEKQRRIDASREHVESVVAAFAETLDEIGVFSLGDADEVKVFVRDIYTRAGLEKRESERLASIYTKIKGIFHATRQNRE